MEEENLIMPRRTVENIPPAIDLLFQQLHRRRFQIGIDDYLALQRALHAGFGLTSREALCDLCCALWAKSKKEKIVLLSLFEQLHFSDWQLPGLERSSPVSAHPQPEVQHEEHSVATPEKPPVTQAYSNLPSISINPFKLSKSSFVFVPQFPITYREVAQVWRRLRKPVREGSPIELDIDATIAQRSRSGITSSVVLRPPRRNKSRLLLLVDRQGSMAPFHHLCEEVSLAIQQAARLEYVGIYYYHDVPAEGADETPLALLDNQLFPNLDPVLAQIKPLEAGYLYADSEMFSPQPLQKVLQSYANGTNVVLISDAGAARGRYDILRLLDTIAFLKALRTYTSRFVWLNPLPRAYWVNNQNTATQIARHIPMFPMDNDGLSHAVNTLRGQPYTLERPL